MRIQYEEKTERFWKIFGGISTIMAFGVANILFGLSDISFFQIGLIHSIVAGAIYLGHNVYNKDWQKMGLYGFALTGYIDFVFHLTFVDINNVNAPNGLEWLLGAINIGIIQIEPAWYYFVDTGFVGGLVLAVGALVAWPRWRPYRYMFWPLIGGMLKSLYYGDLTETFSHLTGGLVSIRNAWEWTSPLGVWIYNNLVGPLSGSTVPYGYVSVGVDFAAVFLIFTFLHGYVIWMAAVISRRMISGKDRYGEGRI